MIYVISTGMGDYLDLTGRAIKALNECEIIVGYKKYVGVIEKNQDTMQESVSPNHLQKETAHVPTLRQ